MEVPEQEGEGPMVGGIFPNQKPLPLTLWETRFLQTPSGRSAVLSGPVISRAFEGRNERSRSTVHNRAPSDLLPHPRHCVVRGRHLLLPGARTRDLLPRG